jgi:antitoxin VapB
MRAQMMMNGLGSRCAEVPNIVVALGNRASGAHPPNSLRRCASELSRKTHSRGICLGICQESRDLRFCRRRKHAAQAKIFMNNRSQAVRLPKEFQFSTHEVFARREGSDIVLSPRLFDWSSYLAEGPVASATFMEGIEDLPVQEREPCLSGQR